MPVFSTFSKLNGTDSHVIAGVVKHFLRFPYVDSSGTCATLTRSPFFLGYVTGALEALVQHFHVPEHRHAHIIGKALDQLFPNLPSYSTDAAHGAGHVCGLSGMRRYLAGGPVCHVLEWMQPADAAPHSGLRAHAAAIAQAMRAAGYGPEAFRVEFPPLFLRQVGRRYRAADMRDAAIAEAVMLALSV